MLRILRSDKVVGRYHKTFIWVDHVGIVLRRYKAFPHVLVQVAKLGVRTLADFVSAKWEFSLCNVANIA